MVGMAVVAAGVVSMGASVSHNAIAQMTVPILTSVSLRGASVAGHSIAVPLMIPEPTPVDRSQGFVELRGAVVLLVRSNVPWTLSVRVLEPEVSGTIQARVGEGPYLPVGVEGVSFTRGEFGQYEVAVDFRIPLTGAWTGGTVTLVYTVVGG
ncbi:MAG: hypothetical protein NUV94_04565 [Candidatus Acetothermia bacterium]|nr:hypothetical protein [Candidatus Acetothermia bacterium]